MEKIADGFFPQMAPTDVTVEFLDTGFNQVEGVLKIKEWVRAISGWQPL